MLESGEIFKQIWHWKTKNGMLKLTYIKALWKYLSSIVSTACHFQTLKSYAPKTKIWQSVWDFQIIDPLLFLVIPKSQKLAVKTLPLSTFSKLIPLSSIGKRSYTIILYSSKIEKWSLDSSNKYNFVNPIIENHIVWLHDNI